MHPLGVKHSKLCTGLIWILLFVGTNEGADIYGKCGNEKEQCPSGSVCKWVGCWGQICVCENKTLPSADRKSCVQGTPIGNQCTEDTVCNGIPFSHCKDSTCSCLEGYRLSINKTHCLPIEKDNSKSSEYGQRCDKFMLCALDLVCTNGICGCKEGSRLATEEEKFAEPTDYRYCLPSTFKIGQEVNGPECGKENATTLVNVSTSTGRPKSTLSSSTTSTSISTTSVNINTQNGSTTTSKSQESSPTSTTLTTSSTSAFSISTTASTESQTAASTKSSTPGRTLSTTNSFSSSAKSTRTSSSQPTTSPISPIQMTTTATTTDITSTMRTTPSTTQPPPHPTKPSLGTESTSTQLATEKTTPTFIINVNVTENETTSSHTTVMLNTTHPPSLPISTTTFISPSAGRNTTATTTSASTITSSTGSSKTQPTTTTPLPSSTDTDKTTTSTTTATNTTISTITSPTSSSTAQPTTIMGLSQTPTNTEGTTSLSTVTTTPSTPAKTNTTVGLGDECSNSNCPEYSECVKDACNVERCRCELGYANSPDNKRCWKLSALGEVCSEGTNRICQGPNTQCDKGICECSDGYERSDNSRWCRLQSSWFVEFPVVGEECSGGFFSECYNDFEQTCVAGKCTCMEGLREITERENQDAIYPDVVQCRNNSFSNGQREKMLCINQSADQRTDNMYEKAKSKIRKVQGGIIGGCVGFVALVGIVIGIVALVRWKRKGRRERIMDTSSTASTDANSRYSFKIPRPFTHTVGAKMYDSMQIAYPNSVFDKEHDPAHSDLRKHSSSSTSEPKPDLVQVGTLGRENKHSDHNT